MGAEARDIEGVETRRVHEQVVHSLLVGQEAHGRGHVRVAQAHRQLPLLGDDAFQNKWCGTTFLQHEHDACGDLMVRLRLSDDSDGQIRLRLLTAQRAREVEGDHTLLFFSFLSIVKEGAQDALSRRNRDAARFLRR